MATALARSVAAFQCTLWNERYPIGTEVMIKHDTGHRTIALTRTPATLNDAGVPILYVDPLSHPFTLDRCRPTRKHPADRAAA